MMVMTTMMMMMKKMMKTMKKMMMIQRKEKETEIAFALTQRDPSQVSWRQVLECHQRGPWICACGLSNMDAEDE
jgi:hypothetical protein